MPKLECSVESDNIKTAPLWVQLLSNVRPCPSACLPTLFPYPSESFVCLSLSINTGDNRFMTNGRHYHLQSAQGQFFFPCSCETAFFICALFLISPCWEEQMAYSEVAVMCAEGWTDECLYISVVYTLSLSPYLDPLCIYLITVSAFAWSSLYAFVWSRLYTFVQMHAHVSVFVCVRAPHKGPTRVHWLGRSACSVVMRASLVWLGGSSAIS